MKHLYKFLSFDMDAFLKGKRLVVTGYKANIDYKTKEHIGTAVETVIAEDNTEYGQKPGEHITNRFEKLVLKVSKDVDVPLNATVVPVDAVATVYGDYRNQLSVKCADIKIVSVPKKG